MRRPAPYPLHCRRPEGIQASRRYERQARQPQRGCPQNACDALQHHQARLPRGRMTATATRAFRGSFSAPAPASAASSDARSAAAATVCCSYREVTLLVLRGEQAHLAPCERGNAHAMCQHWSFLANVTACEQQAAQRVDPAQGDAETRIGRIALLVREIELPKPRVDIVRAKTARESPKQVGLFVRRAGSRQEPDAASTALLASLAQQSRLPTRALPPTSLRATGPLRASWVHAGGRLSRFPRRSSGPGLQSRFR